MPLAQFVDVVTPVTVPPELLLSRMPLFRNCCTMPRPRITTFRCVRTKIPNSLAVEAPPHPVCGSPWPVILYPFKSRVTFEAPIEMQGAPVTVQVTSPVSRLLSVMVNVEEIVPLMSLQYEIVAQARSATTEEKIEPPT